MQIFVEVLPRLGCANVAAYGHGDNLGLDIKCFKNLLKINNEEFVFSDVDLESDSISGLNIKSDGLSFRVKLSQSTNLPVILPQSKIYYGVGKAKYSEPDVCLGQEYALTCSCGAVLGHLTPTRVLPLPSESWQADCFDWYCCISKLREAPKLELRRSDLLYNAYSIIIHKDNISEDVISMDSKNIGTFKAEKLPAPAGCAIKCNVCNREIGISCRNNLQIWGLSVYLKMQDTSTRINKKVNSAKEFFIMLINSFVNESITNMNKFFVKNRDGGESILVWIMDSNLTILRSDVRGLRKEVVIKVLFKEESKDHNNLTVKELPNMIYKEGLETLLTSTLDMPTNFRKANEWSVAYVTKYEIL